MPLLPELAEIALLTLYVSCTSTLLASLLGVPAGAALAMARGRFRFLFGAVTHTMYGLPPVVVGLAVYILLSRAGPLGDLGLLFTPTAMIVAQTLLVLPFVTGLTASAVRDVPPEFSDTAVSLGAQGTRLVRTLLNEARPGILSAVLVGFGRAVSEVGAVLLVGGNVAHHSRVLTTAIVLETQRGAFDTALRLGAILLFLALVTSLAITARQEEAHARG